MKPEVPLNEDFGASGGTGVDGVDTRAGVVGWPNVNADLGGSGVGEGAGAPKPAKGVTG